MLSLKKYLFQCKMIKIPSPSPAPLGHAPVKAAQLISGGQLAIRTLGNSRGIPGGCHGQFTTKKIPNLTYRKTNHIRAEFKTPVHWWWYIYIYILLVYIYYIIYRGYYIQYEAKIIKTPPELDDLISFRSPGCWASDINRPWISTERKNMELR